ncbi:MAG: hypothetical protein ACRC6I_13405, partial [Paracoccaceae bacterium]
SFDLSKRVFVVMACIPQAAWLTPRDKALRTPGQGANRAARVEMADASGGDIYANVKGGIRFCPNTPAL